MRILVLGGDGFCGWPTALHLSARGHEVAIVDNLSRRRIDEELGVQSLTPISDIETRVAAWQEVSGRIIEFIPLTVGKDFDGLLDILRTWRPDSVVHFAEQRAAPYSMKSAQHKRYTVDNNLNATNDVLAAIVESGLDIHLAHLGTMGVYGYGTAGASIPEGYLTVKVETPDGWVEREILYPANPGSIYHMTKTQDALLFQFYAKNDKLRITDLHQGIVWGCQTAETRMDERLINRFDYDGDYGTVLNRFLIQAAVGYPLTVHGTGGQTRAFINIQDTVRCIELALTHPPERGERVKVMNQMTECHRVRDLAALVAKLTDAEIAYLPNPRAEADENELAVENRRLLGYGLEPITLAEGLLLEATEIARRFASRADLSKIPCVSHWNAERAAAAGGAPPPSPKAVAAE
ncbi:MAG: NAD-dependent epimerase/dehydratase family protein [Phenylobacterium sp.]|uniref:NAD-dependent epimerase/dehydratase family protein n=1 Tax=Phenylobacterium sp. TaxID=1871053 RepID=UPI00391DC883